MTTSRFDRMKKKLNKPQNKGQSQSQNGNIRTIHDNPEDGGNFDRIKARLQELGSHHDEEPVTIGVEKYASHAPKPAFNDTIEASVPNVGDEPSTGDPSTTMPNPYTDLSNPPSSLALEDSAFSLETSLSDSIAQEDIGIELDRQQASTPYAKETPVHFDRPSDDPQNRERRIPQLSLDHLEGSKPAKDAEYTSNVKTLIKLVNELPEGVTKQTGAQIIRLTMEAMGIIMEDVLSEAQGAQSEMLEAVRGNIKKIEEYKTVIRKLESDIKYYQGRANELSEIIDLFILSSTTKHHDMV